MYNLSWQDPREAETKGQRRERKSQRSEGSLRSSRRSIVSTSSSERESIQDSFRKLRPFDIFRKGSTRYNSVDAYSQHRNQSLASVETPPLSPLLAMPILPDPLKDKKDLSITVAELSCPTPPVSTPDVDHIEFATPLPNPSKEKMLSECVQNELRPMPKRPKPSPIPIVGPHGDQAYSGMDTTYLVIRDEVSQQLADYFEHSKSFKNNNPGSEIKVPLSATFFIEKDDVRSVVAAEEKMECPNVPPKLPLEVAERLTPTTESFAALKIGSVTTEIETVPVSGVEGVVPHLEIAKAVEEVSISTPSNGQLPECRAVISTTRLPVLASPFERTLRRMESATVQVLSKRLDEEWDLTEPELREEIKFEKQLWALTALYQFDIRDPMQLDGVPGTSSAPEDTPKVSPEERAMKILYLHGDAADGWHLAVKNPNASVDHLSFGSTQPKINSMGEAPSNLHWRSQSSKLCPFPYDSSSCDLILTRNLPTAIRSTDWPSVLDECVRMLRPGGRLAVSVLDPTPSNMGPRLQQWISSNLTVRLERKFRITQPGALLPLWLDDLEDMSPLQSVSFPFAAVDAEAKRVKVPFEPNEPNTKAKLHDTEAVALGELKTLVGRHFYTSLYKDFVPTASDGEIAKWWWDDSTIVQECRERGCSFELLTYWYQKK
ncbi:MAG: hypothetical protein M1833_003700 [Piccolia ochrophora]|nr:MAG: hypothetical protein M1833_003700 [Piccolia ochrophora]